MFLFIVGCVLLLVAVIALIARGTLPKRDRFDHPNEARGYATGTAVIAGLLAVLVVASSFFNRVPPREVGVETVWGQYNRTLDSGWHPAAPWAKVETFPTTFQESAPDVNVGFKGGSGGVQPVKAQWTITGDEAKALWERFRTFDQTNSQLIDNAINEETVKAFRDRTPAEVVNEDGVAEKMRAQVQEAVTKRLAPYGVTVDSLAFYSAVRPDDNARGNIEKVQSATADAERASIALQAAKDQAEADKIRNQESTPESIALQCLEITNRWDQNRNGQLPATWNCFGGSESNVLVNSNK